MLITPCHVTFNIWTSAVSITLNGIITKQPSYQIQLATCRNTLPKGSHLSRIQWAIYQQNFNQQYIFDSPQSFCVFANCLAIGIISYLHALGDGSLATKCLLWQMERTLSGMREERTLGESCTQPFSPWHLLRAPEHRPVPDPVLRKPEGTHISFYVIVSHSAALCLWFPRRKGF